MAVSRPSVSTHCYYEGKQRSKKESEQNTNRPNPGGHERKIVNKLMNAEKNTQAAASTGSKIK